MKKRRVRVHFIDRQTSIEGIQVRRTRGDLVLDAAELLYPDGKTEALEGRTAIPVAQILFKQELT